MSGVPDSSLFDIAPTTEIVVAGGKRHEIRGVPLGVMLKIGTYWPPLLKLLTGSVISSDEFAAAPDAVGEFIAAGFGLPENAAAVAKAKSLPLDIQMDLFVGILKKTLGGGASPFSEKIAEIVNTFSDRTADTKKKAAANGGQKPSSISVLEADTHQTKSGN